MNLELTDEFRQLCREVIAENRTAEEWLLAESDDMFQSTNFVGGYDGIERAFCFSYYDPSGAEYWFQLTIEEVSQIARGLEVSVAIRPADK